jgi:hypothetical protein
VGRAMWPEMGAETRGRARAARLWRSALLTMPGLAIWEGETGLEP